MADPSQIGACRYLGFDGEHCVLQTNSGCFTEYNRYPYVNILGWSSGVYCSGGQMSPLASPCINGCIRTLRACPRFSQHNTCFLVYNHCEQACCGIIRSQLPRVRSQIPLFRLTRIQLPLGTHTNIYDTRRFRGSSSRTAFGAGGFRMKSSTSADEFASRYTYRGGAGRGTQTLSPRNGRRANMVARRNRAQRFPE